MDIRMALLKKNVFASFLLKGCSAFFVFMLVPLTLKCLDAYQNGVWLAISSMLLWIDNMDIGLGNGLRNKLAEFLAEGNNKKARQAVSSTMFMLIAIIVPFTIRLEGIIASIDTYGFMNVDREIVGNYNSVLVVSSILVCTTFIFKFIGNLYLGLQMPAVSNLLVTCGQGLNLLITYLLYMSGKGSLLAIAISNTLSPLLVYLIAYPITFFKVHPELRPSIRLVKMDAVKELFSLGWQFFFIQIASTLIFMTSNILLSQMFSPEVVTPYQICYKYFSILLIGFTIIIAPFWSASTDAFAQNDFGWINRAHRIMDRIMILMSAGTVGMIALSGIFYDIWLDYDIEIPLHLTIAMAVYYLVIVFSMRYSYFLNGFGALRLQLICTVAAAVLFMPLAKIVLEGLQNPVFILYVMSGVQLPGLVINIIQYRMFLGRKARGIWAK